MKNDALLGCCLGIVGAQVDILVPKEVARLDGLSRPVLVT